MCCWIWRQGERKIAPGDGGVGGGGGTEAQFPTPIPPLSAVPGGGEVWCLGCPTCHAGGVVGGGGGATSTAENDPHVTLIMMSELLMTERGGRVGGWGDAPRDALEGGEASPPPPPPPGCPAYAQPLPPERQVPASMAFVTGSNRPQPVWQPPPTACLTASGTAFEAPSLLMHPWPAPALCSYGRLPKRGHQPIIPFCYMVQPPTGGPRSAMLVKQHSEPSSVCLAQGKWAPDDEESGERQVVQTGAKLRSETETKRGNRLNSGASRWTQATDPPEYWCRDAGLA